MHLYLLRHADAETSAPSDDVRDLSDKGREQARRMGRFCRRHHLQPEIIISSPFLRATETARLVAKELECSTTVEAFLAGGMTPGTAMDGLRAFHRFEKVMVIGHEPDLSALAATLLGIPDPQALHFRKASLAGIEFETLRAGAGRLEFLIPAKLA